MFNLALFQDAAQPSGPNAFYTLLDLLIAIPCTIWIYIDSKKRGYVDKQGETHKMQPAFWAVTTFFVWWAMIPIYFLFRKPVFPKFQK
jgi:hypothetical protein